LEYSWGFFSFWGFANDITKVSESKRFYSLFGIGASLAMFVAGSTIVHFSNVTKHLPNNIDSWSITLKYLMSIVFVLEFLLWLYIVGSINMCLAIIDLK